MYVALFGSLQAMMMAKEGIRATNVEGFVHNDLKGLRWKILYRLQHDVLHNKVDAILWDIVKRTEGYSLRIVLGRFRFIRCKYRQCLILYKLRL